MSTLDALEALSQALSDAGYRVALRDGDITPPCVYVRIGRVSDATGTLEGALLVNFWLHYINVRGVDNLTADAQALDGIYAALFDLTWGEMLTTAMTVTAKNEPWPCYRVEASLLSSAAVALTRGS